MHELAYRRGTLERKRSVGSSDEEGDDEDTERKDAPEGCSYSPEIHLYREQASHPDGLRVDDIGPNGRCSIYAYWKKLNSV